MNRSVIVHSHRFLYAASNDFTWLTDWGQLGGLSELRQVAIEHRSTLFGRGGVPEFGDPDKEDDFRALLGYSPYHRIRDGVRYPAFLVTASAADERADAMHARKLVARLQEASRGGPVLVRVEWSAGHAGAAGQDAAIEKRSDELAFALAATADP